MQKELLIKKLQELPTNTEVVIVDLLDNFKNDDPDGSSAGIFPAFDVELIKNAAEGGKDFISLGFSR